MALLLRLALVLAGAAAALFVARDAPKFEVVQGLVGIVVITAALLAVALTRR